MSVQTLGTPVVCTDMEIFHEVAGNGALFFDPTLPKQFADKVLKLNDQQFQNELIQRGYKQAENFTWKRSAQALYDICQKLVDNRL